MTRLTTLFVACLIAAAALGAERDTSRTSKHSLAKLTCEQFLELDVEIQPRVTYWAVAYAADDDAEEAWIDVDVTEELTAVVIEECRKTPKESFWRKLKSKFRHHRN